jgi:hypothetical protein
VQRYTVVRVADEIVVDLMKSACGVSYDEAAPHIEARNVALTPLKRAPELE